MSIQRSILNWAHETFGDVALDRQERAMRLVEEAIELAQAEGVAPTEVVIIAARVFSRPPGDTRREVGQVAMTLTALAENIGLSVTDERDNEFARVVSLPPDHFKERHEAKVQLGMARPTI